MKETEVKDEKAFNSSHIESEHVRGSYQLKSAKIAREGVVRAAKIGARARYFQGTATLLGAFGIFGGFAFTLYKETKEVQKQSEELKNNILNQEKIILKLAESYSELAKFYGKENRLEESKEFQDKAQEIKKSFPH